MEQLVAGSSRRTSADELHARHIGRGAAIALCVGSAVGIAGLAIGGLFALLGGGYEPQDYAGTIDPVRAGLAAFLLTGAGLFGFFAVGTLVGALSAYRCGAKLEAVESLGIAAFCGITSVWGVAMAGYAALGPAEPAPLPSPIRELTFVVGGAFGVAIIAGLLKTAAHVWRIRDRNGALALGGILLIAVWFAYQVVTR